MYDFRMLQMAAAALAGLRAPLTKQYGTKYVWYKVLESTVEHPAYYTRSQGADISQHFNAAYEFIEEGQRMKEREWREGGAALQTARLS